MLTIGFNCINSGVVPVTNLMDKYTIVIEGQVGSQVAFGDIRYLKEFEV